MFYCMDANKLDLTYILFYNVFIIEIIVSKIIYLALLDNNIKIDKLIFTYKKFYIANKY